MNFLFWKSVTTLLILFIQSDALRIRRAPNRAPNRPGTVSGHFVPTTKRAATTTDKRWKRPPFTLSEQEFDAEYRFRIKNGFAQRGQLKTIVRSADSRRGVVAVKTIKLIRGHDANSKAVAGANREADRERDMLEFLSFLDDKCPYIINAYHASPLLTKNHCDSNIK